MLNCESMIGQVVKLMTKFGTSMAARLIEISDDGYIQLRFRDGKEAFVALDSIVYITPINNQPLPSEVV